MTVNNPPSVITVPLTAVTGPSGLGVQYSSVIGSPLLNGYRVPIVSDEFEAAWNQVFGVQAWVRLHTLLGLPDEELLRLCAAARIPAPDPSTTLNDLERLAIANGLMNVAAQLAVCLPPPNQK